MTLLSFAVLIVVAQQTGERIQDFDGLAKRSPFLAFAMLDCNDLARRRSVHRRIFREVLHLRRCDPSITRLRWSSVGVITVACGFYYYLKVVRAMYWEEPSSSDVNSSERAFARRDDCANGCDYRARSLSAADSGCTRLYSGTEIATELLLVSECARSLSSTFQ